METKRLKCRESFVFYSDFFETLFALGAQASFEVLHALSAHLRGRDYALEGAAQVAFIPIRQVLDRDNEKFQQVCQQRSQAGRKSAELRRKSETTKGHTPKATSSTCVDFVALNSTNPTEYENESEYENENEIGIENDIGNECETGNETAHESANEFENEAKHEHDSRMETENIAEGSTVGDDGSPFDDGTAADVEEEHSTEMSCFSADAHDKPLSGVEISRKTPPKTSLSTGGRLDYNAVMAGFNSMFSDSLPRVKMMTTARRQAVKQRLAVHGAASLAVVMHNVLQSPFLMGQNDRGWHADFDWIFRPTNYVKILEGNYNRRNADSRNSPDGTLSDFYNNQNNSHLNTYQNHAADRQDFKQDANRYALHQFAVDRNRRGTTAVGMDTAVEKPF